MPNQRPIAVVACGVLSLDLQRTAEELGIDPHFELLPGGLHNHPEELRRRVQQAVDALSGSGSYDRIVIGYGICGRGTVGIHARTVPLAIPRVHDCIALFLGSDASYRREFERFPGTYYISAGWYEQNIEPLSQKRPYVFMDNRRVFYDDLVRQCGEEQAKKTFDFFSSWKKNYQRAAFIDTGVGRREVYAAHAQAMAEKNGWRFERLNGGHSLLTELLTAHETSDGILLVPPGYCTVFDTRQRGLASCPAGELAEELASTGIRVEHIRSALEPETGQARFGLGIDAGGTYTDAVLFDLAGGRLLSKNKALTTRFDFTVGIGEALAGLDPHLLRHTDLVAVSTTLATNAIVEGRGCRVGLLLMPPYEGFDGREIAHDPTAVISGRMTIAGEVARPIDKEEIRRISRRMIDRHQVAAFAVSGYGGSVNPSLELEVKRIIRMETGLLVTCGHELSELLDFQTRARTAVLNARIVPLLVRLLEDLQRNLRQRGITTPIMVVKGDGSLMSAAMAMERPVETILSGPAASVAGARFLTGLEHALVVDMGGTTTDTAVLADGRVRVNESGCRIGGIRTHVKAMEIRTTGLGGDSLIGYEKGAFTIGPRRVAPVAWLGEAVSGASAAIDYMEAHLPRFRLSMQDAQILTLTGHNRQVDLSDDEKRIVELLSRRPYTVAELTRHVGGLCPALLPLGRLEDALFIQRCGLTPTDLLHQNGQFLRWDSDSAKRICTIHARIAGMPVTQMVTSLLERIVRQLALELMKRQLDEDTQPEGMDDCEMCQALVDRMLGVRGNGYQVRFKLHHPVVGIGAPIGHFLPAAASLLGTGTALPEHVEVANAIGAVTAKVVIRRSVRIKPDQHGGFFIEGLPDAGQFMRFEDAEAYARESLIERVRTLARLAGTRRDDMELQVEDQTAKTAEGEDLFLERRLTALLVGAPAAGTATAVVGKGGKEAKGGHRSVLSDP
jgi:N-methylhydantoinase A/oxoprolinase/acetone carboxylase beta subunit